MIIIIFLNLCYHRHVFTIHKNWMKVFYIFIMFFYTWSNDKYTVHGRSAFFKFILIIAYYFLYLYLYLFKTINDRTLILIFNNRTFYLISHFFLVPILNIGHIFNLFRLSRIIIYSYIILLSIFLYYFYFVLMPYYFSRC